MTLRQLAKDYPLETWRIDMGILSLQYEKFYKYTTSVTVLFELTLLISRLSDDKEPNHPIQLIRNPTFKGNLSISVIVIWDIKIEVFMLQGTKLWDLPVLHTKPKNKISTQKQSL